MSVDPQVFRAASNYYHSSPVRIALVPAPLAAAMARLAQTNHASSQIYAYGSRIITKARKLSCCGLAR